MFIHLLHNFQAHKLSFAGLEKSLRLKIYLEGL